MYKQITLLNFDGHNKDIHRNNGDRNLNLLVKGGIKFEIDGYYKIWSKKIWIIH